MVHCDLSVQNKEAEKMLNESEGGKLYELWRIKGYDGLCPTCKQAKGGCGADGRWVSVKYKEDKS